MQLLLYFDVVAEYKVIPSLFKGYKKKGVRTLGFIKNRSVAYTDLSKKTKTHLIFTY